MTYGTWNISSFYIAHALNLVTSEAEKYKINLIGVK
jgi:hypothetical protein